MSVAPGRGQLRLPPSTLTVIRATGGGRKRSERASKLSVHDHRRPHGIAAVDDPDGVLREGFEAHNEGRLSDAERLYRRALSTRPNHPGALRLLGLIACQVGKPAEAVELLGRALDIQPDMYQSWCDLGTAHLSLGAIGEASRCYHRSIQLEPTYPTAHFNLGRALERAGDRTGAVNAYRQAVTLDPDYAAAHTNLAHLLRRMGRIDSAEASARQAIAARSDYVEAHYALALVLQDQGRIHEAAEAARTAIGLRPDHRPAHRVLGAALLTEGRLREGWTHWRKGAEPDPQQPAVATPGLTPPPCWEGQPIEGKRLLVVMDRVLSDSLQFARYGRLLMDAGAEVVMEAPFAMVELLRASNVAHDVRANGQALEETFDYQATVGCLPGIMGTTLDTIPAHVPYLTPAERARDVWTSRLALGAEPKIGLVWAGSGDYAFDHLRSVRLSLYRPLINIQGLRFFSLQKGPRSVELDRSALSDRLGDLSHHLKDLNEAAAAIERLDLVISVDTAVAHLAGALGKPVWLLVPRVPDWRWMLERTDSPWYPTMRLFRQQDDNWDSVMAEMARRLRLADF